MKKIAAILIAVLFCTACSQTSAVSSSVSSVPTAQSEQPHTAADSLLQKSNLVYSDAPLSTSTSRIGFQTSFEDQHYLAGVYDVDAQSGYYLCDVENCTHSDKSCPAYIKNIVHRGQFFTDTYSAYVVDDGSDFWLCRYDFATRKKTASKLPSDIVHASNGFTTDFSGTANDGDTIYITLELDNGSSKIISVNTLTGETKDIVQYPSTAGIQDVCGNTLITWHWSSNHYDSNPDSPNATFCIYDIVPLDGAAPKQLFLMPLNTHTVYTDGKTCSFYYSKLNTVSDYSTGQSLQKPDGIIYRLDMATGKSEEVVRLPAEGSLWISIQNCIDNNLLVLLQTSETENAIYKVDLAAKSAELWSIDSPVSTQAYPQGATSYAGDNMLVAVADISSPAMYSIKKSDFLAGNPNYTMLEGSEILWQQGQ